MATKITKLETEYILEDDKGFKIRATVKEYDKTIDVTTPEGKQFCFLDSDPTVVLCVAALIQRASELVFLPPEEEGGSK